MTDSVFDMRGAYSAMYHVTPAVTLAGVPPPTTETAGAPGAPAGPVGPVAPVGPVGPVEPGDPATLHVSSVSFLPHVFPDRSSSPSRGLAAPGMMMRSWPALLTHAEITPALVTPAIATVVEPITATIASGTRTSLLRSQRCTVTN